MIQRRLVLSDQFFSSVGHIDSYDYIKRHNKVCVAEVIKVAMNAFAFEE